MSKNKITGHYLYRCKYQRVSDILYMKIYIYIFTQKRSVFIVPDAHSAYIT